MGWTAAIKLKQLQQTNRETIVLEGNKILIIWHDEQVHAVAAQCPHMKLPLAKGTINDDCELVCPFHKSAFDLTTGAVKCRSPWPPVLGALLAKLSKPKELKIYPTRIENDEIFVELPAAES